MVKNFTGFAPLGLVLTMTLAIGMCEESGLIRALLTDKMKNIPPVILPFVIAFVGTCGNLASDTAMVVIPPIAAILYLAAGKHPVVGMICGYAGAQAGFSANLMIAGTDSLLQGITNTALDGFLGEGVYKVDVTCNWIFMFASTFMCALVIGWVCNWIVDKRFGKYEPTEEVKAEMSLEEISADEKKGLRWAGISCLIYLALILVLFFFGPLAKIGDDGKRALVGSPLISNLIPILFFFFVIPGLVFGFVSKKFKESKDIVKGMNHQMSAMGSYVVFCFFCGQFNALFNWTNLGTIIAVAGAIHPAHRSHQPAGALRLRQVGHPGARVRAHADAAQLPPRLHPADVPLGRLPHQRLHAAVPVPLGYPGRGAGQVRQGSEDRYSGRRLVPHRHRAPDRLDHLPGHLDADRHQHRTWRRHPSAGRAGLPDRLSYAAA